MNYDSYKKTLNIFFIVFIMSFFIDQLGELLVKESPIYRKFHYYSGPILSLIFLYIGIYSQIAGVKASRIWQWPSVFIIIGVIWVTMSIGTPILAHLVYKVDPLLTGAQADELERIKVSAINGKPYTAEGYTNAHRYYLETGATITYRDEKKLGHIQL